MNFKIHHILGLVFVILVLLYIYHVTMKKNREGVTSSSGASLGNFITAGMRNAGWNYFFNNEVKDDKVAVYNYISNCQEWINTQINGIINNNGEVTAGGETITGVTLAEFDDELIKWAKGEINNHQTKYNNVTGNFIEDSDNPEVNVFGYKTKNNSPIGNVVNLSINPLNPKYWQLGSTFYTDGSILLYLPKWFEVDDNNKIKETSITAMRSIEDKNTSIISLPTTDNKYDVSKTPNYVSTVNMAMLPTGLLVSTSQSNATTPTTNGIPPPLSGSLLPLSLSGSIVFGVPSKNDNGILKTYYSVRRTARASITSAYLSLVGAYCIGDYNYNNSKSSTSYNQSSQNVEIVNDDTLNNNSNFVANYLGTHKNSTSEGEDVPDVPISQPAYTSILFLEKAIPCSLYFTTLIGLNVDPTDDEVDATTNKASQPGRNKKKQNREKRRSRRRRRRSRSGFTSINEMPFTSMKVMKLSPSPYEGMIGGMLNTLRPVREGVDPAGGGGGGGAAANARRKGVLRSLFSQFGRRSPQSEPATPPVPANGLAGMQEHTDDEFQAASNVLNKAALTTSGPLVGKQQTPLPSPPADQPDHGAAFHPTGQGGQHLYHEVTNAEPVYEEMDYAAMTPVRVNPATGDAETGANGNMDPTGESPYAVPLPYDAVTPKPSTPPAQTAKSAVYSIAGAAAGEGAMIAPVAPSTGALYMGMAPGVPGPNPELGVYHIVEPGPSELDTTMEEADKVYKPGAYVSETVHPMGPTIDTAVRPVPVVSDPQDRGSNLLYGMKVEMNEVMTDWSVKRGLVEFKQKNPFDNTKECTTGFPESMLAENIPSKGMGIYYLDSNNRPFELTPTDVKEGRAGPGVSSKIVIDMVNAAYTQVPGTRIETRQSRKLNADNRPVDPKEHPDDWDLWVETQVISLVGDDGEILKPGAPLAGSEEGIGTFLVKKTTWPVQDKATGYVQEYGKTYYNLEYRFAANGKALPDQPFMMDPETREPRTPAQLGLPATYDLTLSNGDTLPFTVETPRDFINTVLKQGDKPAPPRPPKPDPGPNPDPDPKPSDDFDKEWTSNDCAVSFDEECANMCNKNDDFAKKCLQEMQETLEASDDQMGYLWGNYAASAVPPVDTSWETALADLDANRPQAIENMFTYLGRPDGGGMELEQGIDTVLEDGDLFPHRPFGPDGPDGGGGDPPEDLTTTMDYGQMGPDTNNPSGNV